MSAYIIPITSSSYATDGSTLLSITATIYDMSNNVGSGALTYTFDLNTYRTVEELSLAIGATYITAWNAGPTYPGAPIAQDGSDQVWIMGLNVFSAVTSTITFTQK